MQPVQPTNGIAIVPEIPPPPPSAIPNELSDEMYAAIGRAAVMWGHLEQAVGVAISALLETPLSRFVAIAANMATGAPPQSIVNGGGIDPSLRRISAVVAKPQTVSRNGSGLAPPRYFWTA